MDIVKVVEQLGDLQKGDRIEFSEIERLTKVKRTSSSFGIMLMGIRKTLEDSGMITRQSKARLEILTDAEAVSVNHERYVKSVESMFRKNRLQKLIDTGNLNKDQRDQNDRAISVQDRINSSVSETVQKSLALPYRKEWPKLNK